MRFQLPTFIIVALYQLALAQYPPRSNFSSVIKSPINPNITISYKSPLPGTCTTVFNTQKQYTGYVNLPPFTLEPIQQNYSINTFFWFIEARQHPETAPLTIWLNGGPGSSSMIGLFQEAGPCEVVQLADGSYGTQARMWGWDRSSNVLFIDQPNQVGLSYDTLRNMSFETLNGGYYPPGPAPALVPDFAWLNGTTSSGISESTANTTEVSAQAMWHFLQGWLAAFPQYNPGTRPNSTQTLPTGVNIFAESYGGHYGPSIAFFFEEQNARRLNGSLPRNSTLEIHLASLGIINGIIDSALHDRSYPDFLYNNTYGLQLIDQTDRINAITNFTDAGGCGPLTDLCRARQAALDPENEGDSADVNDACRQADAACTNIYTTLMRATGISPYDIRQKDPSPFPPSAYLEYLNTAAVQSSIGVPLNFTSSSWAVYSAFEETGDNVRSGDIEQIAKLLDLGVRVALLYGDADFICNWVGGEAASLSIAAQSPKYARFYNAGYADIIVNSSYVGGQVRQLGNLSFSRIYDSGHLVPAYQPETAFTVFTRIIQGTSIARGETVNLTNYNTTGPANSTHANKASDSEDPVCWVRDVLQTCTQNQFGAIIRGEGVVIGGVWYANERDYKAPSSSIKAGTPGNPPSSSSSASSQESSKDGSSTTSSAATGVYVAAGSSTPSSNAIRREPQEVITTVLCIVVAAAFAS